MEPVKPPAGPVPIEDRSVIRYNARLGMVFFLLYLSIYAIFVVLCTFKLDWMSHPWIGGVNVAIWYGFGLIASAFIMATAYLMLCKK